MKKIINVTNSPFRFRTSMSLHSSIRQDFRRPNLWPKIYSFSVSCGDFGTNSLILEIRGYVCIDEKFRANHPLSGKG